MGLVICIDFDGTLINANSFPKWIKFIMIMSLKFGHFSLFFRVLFLLFFRKIIPILSHSEFKSYINSLNYPDSWASNFCFYLRKSYCNDLVKKKIESSRTNIYIITTAAPYCYAKDIPSFFLFNGQKPKLLCSIQAKGKFSDNYKINKKVNTLSLLNDLPFILYTDHSDDIELAKEAEEVFLCNPKDACIKQYNDAGILFDLIKD